jgi:DNA-3-methyladenine glycosylase II
VGAFFAAGIVLRGAGRTDAFPDEGITRAGIRRFYGLGAEPSDAEVERITDAWRPYRMWCSVLIHACERRARLG